VAVPVVIAVVAVASEDVEDRSVVIVVVAVASVVVAEDSVVIAVVAVASEDVDAVVIEAVPLWPTEVTSLLSRVRK